MSEENISIFRQELERVKAQFEDMFQDIMTSVRADRENDKRTLQMVNENVNNDRKTIDQNRALNDKLETLLNVQNTMLSELRSMNNSVKDLSGGGGGMGGILAGAAAGGLAGFFLNGSGGNNVDGGGGDGTRNTGGGDGTRNTGGGGDNNTRNSNIETRLPNGVANKEIPLEAQAFLNVLTAQGYEGTEKYPNSGYNTIVGYGGQFEGYERHPNRVGTVTSAGPSTAAGRYQIVKRTWDRLTRDYPEILTDFSPENQDLAAWILAQEDYERRTNGRNLLEDLKTEDPERLAYIERMLSGTWSSLKGGVHEGTAAGSFPELFRQNISDLREEERQQREEEADAERVESEQAERISSDQFIRGHLKEMGVAGDGMSLYNPTIRGQQGAGKVHGSSYRGASNAVRAYWTKEQLEAAGLSTGENEVQLTNPNTGELETVNINIQSFDGGNNFATTDFIGTGTLGESREYWNPKLDQAQIMVQQLGGSLGDLDRREKLNLYIQQNEGITIPYSEVDVPGPEDARPYPVEAADQFGRINKYVSENFEPVEQQTPAEDISGGNSVDNVDVGGDGSDTLDEPTTSDQEPEPELDDSGDNTPDNTPVEPQDTPLGPRIPEISEETPTQQDEETSPEPPPLTEQDPFDPFSLVSPMRLSRDLTTIGLDENPEVRAALEEQAAAGTEETPRETTRETPSGGYTGGGGGSREQAPEQPQIEANAIGRFPWADKLIKYYNLSNMIKTNMLS